MNDVLERLWLWFWRLVPANPILLRVVHGGARRVRHLWLRVAYLGVLVFVVLVAMAADFGASASTLSELAKNASTVFMWASITQLALMCFLAPVFTAGAITQERDAQTFNILLSTPLSNAQIVLGSLMSRLYFVLVLLLAGLPIFLMTMVYGGVTLGQILRSVAIAGSTAVVTGSLAICISMIRVGTRRTIFSFFMMIAVYLLAVYALGRWDRTWVPEAPANVDGQQMSWLSCLHPFLALDVALNRVPAPEAAALGGYGAIARRCLESPHRTYVVLALGSSFLLTLVAAFFVRRAKEAESGLWRSALARLLYQDVGDRRRKPKHVWKNPVAWREAMTRASAATRGFLQVALLGGGVICAIVLVWTHIEVGLVAQTRQWLSVVLMIELGLILIVATYTAATAMTKEKESKTLELLLVTPLTSRYLVWGKLRGLITFTVPMVAVPACTVIAFGIHGLSVGRGGEPVVAVETGVELAVLLLFFAAAACMLGLHVSLHSRKTVQAVMVSVGVVVVASLVTYYVFDSIVRSADQFGAAIAPLTPFTAVQTLVDPVRMFDSAAKLGERYGGVRAWAVVGSALAILVYGLAVSWTYRSMVRNFDMIVRRQSSQI